VGGCAVLRRVVHFNSTYLHLEHKLVMGSDAGVKALVAVGLGLRDVILESKRFGLEESMDGIECTIAVVLAPYDNPEGDQVVLGARWDE